MWTNWSTGRRASLATVSVLAFAAGFVSQQEAVFEPATPDPPQAAPSPTPTVTVTRTASPPGERTGPERSRPSARQSEADLIAQPARGDRADRAQSRSSGLSSSRSSSDEAGGTRDEGQASGGAADVGGSRNGTGDEGDDAGQGPGGSQGDEDAENTPPDVPPAEPEPDPALVQVCLDPLLCAQADLELTQSMSTSIPTSAR